MLALEGGAGRVRQPRAALPWQNQPLLAPGGLSDGRPPCRVRRQDPECSLDTKLLPLPPSHPVEHGESTEFIECLTVHP